MIFSASINSIMYVAFYSWVLQIHGRELRSWMKDLSMVIDTSSWSYSTHLMGKNSPMGCIISMDVWKIHGYVEIFMEFR